MDLNLEVSGVVLHARAAVADQLPVTVIMGTEIPELGSLLHIDPTNPDEGSEDALVTTRAKATVRAQSEAEGQQKQEQMEFNYIWLRMERRPTRPW